MRRILLASGVAAAAIVLFVILRPDSEPASSTTAGTTGGATTTGETTTGVTTTIAPAAPVRIALEMRNGRPVGGVQRPEVKQGERVVVVVRSDVADEVHLHGYDVKREVAPGEPARIAFRARIPGGFEVELEGRHLLLAEIEVQP